MAEFTRGKKRFVSCSHSFLERNACSRGGSRWDVAWQYHSNTQFMATVNSHSTGSLLVMVLATLGTRTVASS